MRNEDELRGELTAGAMQANMRAWYGGTLSLLLEAGWDVKLAQEELSSAIKWAAKQAEKVNEPNSAVREGRVLIAAGEGALGQLRRCAFMALAQDIYLVPAAAAEVLGMWRAHAEQMRDLKIKVGELSHEQ